MERMTYAQAVGEDEPQSIAWIPGDNFDPEDADEMAVMHHIWADERHTRLAQLEAENAQLRAALRERNR